MPTTPDAVGRVIHNLRSFAWALRVVAYVPLALILGVGAALGAFSRTPFLLLAVLVAILLLIVCCVELSLFVLRRMRNLLEQSLADTAATKAASSATDA
jgi:hypothetical protein